MGALVKASIWLTLSELVFNLSGYITHAFLGRSLGPAEYGRYGIVITFSTMIIILIGKGVPIAMSKYLSEVPVEQQEKIAAIKNISAKVQFVVIGLVTIVYFFLAPVFAHILRDDSLTSLFRISSLIIPAFAGASFYVYYYTGIQLFGKQAFLKFFRSIAKVGIIVTLGFLFSTPGAVIGHAIAPFSVFVAAYLLDPYRKFKSVARNNNNSLSLQKLLNFAWPITLFMIFYEIMITVDLYLVKILLGDDKLTGVYNSAITVGRIPFYAFYFLTIILLPKISQTTSRGLKEETKEILSSAMRFMFMFLIPCIALLSAFSPSAIIFFYGAMYTSGAEALSILALGAGFLSVFYVLAFVLNGADKNKVPMWTAFFGCLFNTALVYFLIPILGIKGAAIGTTITSLLAMIVVVLYTSRKIANFLAFIPIFKYIIGSAGVYFLAKNFFVQGRFIFILWSLILLAIYCLYLFFIREIKEKDISFLRNALIKKRFTTKSKSDLI
ncbi:MAG: oligosaccharide flippase family protein [Patescibacteria group bacterium]|nr:oligosaccharide flippase family protein [Patescibacteria group bacterium]